MTLQFDDKDHSVAYGAERIALPPLSFRLLRTLAANGGQPVDMDTLVGRVWPDSAVSPDTVKQRVFLVRKSLEDAGWRDIEITAIRGEGYRLLLPDPAEADPVEPNTAESEATGAEPTPAQRRKAPRRGVLLAAAACVLLILATAIFWGRQAPPVPHSNRVAFWLSPGEEAFSPASASLRAAWRDRLQASANQGRIQLMQSLKSPGDAIPVAARRGRVALVSLMEPSPDAGGDQIRLSIIEPTTATILRSNVLDPADTPAATRLLDQQALAVEALVGSGLLGLTKAQKDDATDPVWARLREVASAP